MCTTFCRHIFDFQDVRIELSLFYFSLSLFISFSNFSYWNLVNVKIVDGGLYFISAFHFIFFFFFLFNFLFLEQLGLGFISHAVTSITN